MLQSLTKSYSTKAMVVAGGVVAFSLWRAKVAHRRIGRSAAYSQRHQHENFGKVHFPNRLGIVIPLLTEQARIPGLLKHFDFLANRASGLEIHLVTSEKEGREVDSTFALCREAMLSRPYLHHYHCQDVDAIMAHQLNLTLDNEEAPEQLIFYNADSRPTLEAIYCASHSLMSEDEGEPRVCQQYGAYVANLSDLNGWSSPILLAAALWQTRWSQAFELSRALENMEPERLNQLRRRKISAGRRLVRMNYVIGHGLTVRRNFMEKLGGFSTRWHNEDAVLGLQLALSGVPIVPNAHLEPADSPDTLRGLVIQKSVWWAGPALAPWYSRNTVRKVDFNIMSPLDPSANRFWSVWIKAAFANHAVSWLLGPSCLAAAMAWAVVAPLPGLLAVAAIWFYLVWPTDAATRNLAFYGLPVPSMGLRLRGAAGAPIMYLLHGLSAWIGLFRAVFRVFSPKLTKPKTPMRSESMARWRTR